MENSEKVKMFLDIGDQRISLTVPYERQEFVREVETEVNDLYSKWRRSFPAKSDREIFAMVAYQYASFYSELKNRYDSATAKAAECLRNAGGEAEQADDPADADE